MEHDGANHIGLLVLDFAGVCTPALAELSTGDPSGPIPIRDDIWTLIEEAKDRQVTIAILSNEISTDWELSHDLFSAADHVIACSDNQIFKPDRRAFQRCLLLADRSATETVVVDDEVDNVTVATSLGMQAVLFDTNDPARSVAAVREMIGT